MQFVWACMVRAQIRGWGGDYGNLSIRALIACLIFLMSLFVLMFCLNFCSFHYSANHFSVTFNFFFKKYISFVLSQYKNEAHCTYCSIGKFFCLFIKLLLLLLKQCSTVSCHGPWLSTVGVGICIDCMKGHFRLWVWFVGWLYYIGHGWVNNSSCSSTWPVILVVPNVYHWSHQVLSPTLLFLANCSTQNG